MTPNEGEPTLFGRVIQMVDKLTARRSAASGVPDSVAPVAPATSVAPDPVLATPPLGASPPSQIDGVGHALSGAYAPGDDLPPEMITLMLQLARDGGGQRTAG